MKTQENIPHSDPYKRILLLESEISHLKEQLNWLQKNLFGKKSEKEIPVNQDQLMFDIFENIEPPKEELKTIKAHNRRSSKEESTKISIPANLPRKRVVLDIPEEEKICAITNKPLIKIGEEISLKLVHTPASYYIKEIVRPKYAFPNGDGIKIANMPDSIIPKCRVDESILADIITKKYADHLPLYRIVEDFARNGITISRQILSKWVIKIGLELKPLFDEMKKRVLLSNNIFIDETPIKMQDKFKLKQAYMWVLVGGQEKDPYYRVYNFKLNRNHGHALEILKDYNGVVHSDKYGAYEQMANKKLFVWCPCWSHIRGKFIESQTDPNFSNYMIRKIRYLFMFERIAWNRSEEERINIRQEKEAPIIDELIPSSPASSIETAMKFYDSTLHLDLYNRFSSLENLRSYI